MKPSVCRLKDARLPRTALQINSLLFEMKLSIYRTSTLKVNDYWSASGYFLYQVADKMYAIKV